MECAVIVTYRCNARCQMCHTWRHPSRQEEEICADIIDRLPGKYARLNITGGEPMLREDILEIVEVLDKKTSRLEISTNGFYTDRIIKVAEKFPDITVRVSLEGLPAKNDRLRGIKDGFDHGLRTILRLKEIGVKDIGFGIVISDRNISDLLHVYDLCVALGIEFGNATMHNSFYFHKHDNSIGDLDATIVGMRHFIRALLDSKRRVMRMRVKDWFRAYLNLGLLNYMQSRPRSLPCGAGTDTFFLDPGGNVLACNGSDEPWIMGNLQTHPFEEIWGSRQADCVRELVGSCSKRCWMTGTAVPAMRKRIWVPILWVVRNKIRLALGDDIGFEL